MKRVSPIYALKLTLEDFTPCLRKPFCYIEVIVKRVYGMQTLITCTCTLVSQF